MRVIQITTIHSYWDNRIYFKICKSLSKKYEVDLYAPYNDRTPSLEGINIRFFKDRGNNFKARMLRAISAMKVAIKHRNEIIHFHDPELLPFMLVARFFNKNIIYDIHEDNSLGIKLKYYLNPIIRFSLRYLILFTESLAHRLFNTIVAERVYLKRFPNAVEVLNFLSEDDLSSNAKNEQRIDREEKTINIIYTGSITVPRGLEIYLNILKANKHIRLTLVGRLIFDTKLYIEEFLSEDELSRLDLISDDKGLEFSKIVEVYKRRDWDFGLAIFPESDHYREKELTKFFEYAYYNIPILCTDFPHWKLLVEGNDLGRAVNPLDIEEINMVINERQKTNRNNIFVNEHLWDSQEKNMFALYEKIIKY